MVFGGSCFVCCVVVVETFGGSGVVCGVVATLVSFVFLASCNDAVVVGVVDVDCFVCEDAVYAMEASKGLPSLMPKDSKAYILHPPPAN